MLALIQPIISKIYKVFNMSLIEKNYLEDKRHKFHKRLYLNFKIKYAVIFYILIS